MRCQSQPDPKSRWQRDEQRRGQHRGRGACAVPTFSAAPGDMCSFTRHSRLAAGQHKACAVTSVPTAQRLGPLPGPGTGLPPSPSAAAGEWKLHPARGEGLSVWGSCGSIPGQTQALRDVPTEPRALPASAHTARVPLQY